MTELDSPPDATQIDAVSGPAARKCRKHNLQLAPDGLCALCRRERNAAAERSAGSSFIGTALFGAVALLGVAIAGYWYAHPEKMPGGKVERPAYKGPSVEDQIAVVDDQLRELRAMQKAGELDGAGLNQISQLEKRRSMLVAIYESQQDN